MEEQTSSSGGRALGVIGLGRMGGPVAARLAGQGYEVVGFDAAGSQDLAQSGVRTLDSVADVTRAADVVLLSLPDGAACSRVVEEVGGTTDRRAGVVVDLSTIGTDAAEACAASLARSGIGYVDAPVSGGIAGASTGKLSLMAAAPDAVLQPVRELLGEIARIVFVVGQEPGQGQAMKLVNNYVSAAALAATFEGVVYGAKHGLDLQQMVDVLNASSGRTTASSDKMPAAVVTGTYDFGFASRAMRKDVGLYLQEVEESDCARAVAVSVESLWGRFVDTHPETDFTYLHRYLADGGS